MAAPLIWFYGWTINVSGGGFAVTAQHKIFGQDYHGKQAGRGYLVPCYPD